MIGSKNREHLVPQHRGNNRQRSSQSKLASALEAFQGPQQHQQGEHQCEEGASSAYEQHQQHQEGTSSAHQQHTEVTISVAYSALSHDMPDEPAVESRQQGDQVDPD